MQEGHRDLHEAILNPQKESDPRKSEDKFRMLSRVVEQTDDSVVVTDQEGLIEYVNPAFEERTGYSREEVLGKTSRIVKSGRHRPEFYQKLWETLRAGEVFRGVLINRKKNGELYYEEKTITPLRNADGVITHFVSTGKDISARMEAEEERSRLAAVLEATTDLVAITSVEGSILYMNRAGKRLLGFGADSDLPQMHIAQISPEWSRALLLGEGIPTALREGVWRGEAAFLDRQEHEIAVSQVLLAHRSSDGGVSYLSLVARDIRYWKTQIAELEFQATHDSLTALPNRAVFLDRLKHALLARRRVKEPLALLLIDIDRFKEINDTWGHHIGDIVLRQLAQRLLTVLRRSDTIARVGGDEFAVLLPNVTVDGATLSARKILKTVEPTFESDGQTLSVRVSIGIAASSEEGGDAIMLMRMADAAMYTAKRESSGLALYRPLPAFPSGAGEGAETMDENRFEDSKLSNAD